MSGRYIIWLGENPASLDPSIVGGKNADLSELLLMGIRVPWGFVVTTEAYRRFAESIEHEVQQIIRGADPSDPVALEETSAAVRELFRASHLPEDIAASIRSAYSELCAKYHETNLPVAVRSSATAEDTTTTSFAGQHETYLWVRGEDDVLRRIVDCWASLYTARAITYRSRKDIDRPTVWMAVGVQKMVKARSSGVMFTLNPSNGDPSKIVIESNWGLGETVVAGLVTPDFFMVDKVTLEILVSKISRKLTECVVVNDKINLRDIPPDRQEAPSISNEEVLELAKLGKFIERKRGMAQDIEWAIDISSDFPDNVYIVQSRPETVWRGKRKPIVGKAKSALDLVVERLVSGVTSDSPS